MNFGHPKKMNITSSELKDYFGKSGKGLITSLGLDPIRRSKKKKAIYDITNISLKDLSEIIKKFEYLPYEVYASKRYKHVRTDS